MNPRTRYVFEHKWKQRTSADSGIPENTRPSPGSEKNKELLVVVKRGRDADIAEKDGSPMMPEDIREWAHGMTWAQIRRLRHDSDDEDDDEVDAFRSANREAMADTYYSVDDYSWR